MPQRTETTPFGLISMASNGKAITNLTWVTEKTKDNDSDAILDQAFHELQEYADGKRHTFTVPVSLENVTESQQDWLTTLQQVAYGETISYSALAERAGKPNAVRAAGSACAKNPIPIIYPCHRITRIDGDLGNFGAIRSIPPSDPRNLSIKAALITHEKSFQPASS
ncbi:MAG: methylated-DNA--[protein]-cysteine S-methyltransferase [Pseudomonadota bacterium]|nr:methylated-DNA--[protein]-cysteine S-methyltransferase [Pseudomonadota bacterium]